MKLLTKLLQMLQNGNDNEMYDLERRVAATAPDFCPWELEGDSPVLDEENRLLMRFEEFGRE